MVWRSWVSDLTWPFWVLPHPGGNSKLSTKSCLFDGFIPSNPFQIPLQLGDVNWYPGTENTAVTGSAPATARQTLTAHELVAEGALVL